jgi:hypothetical protein
MLLMPEIRDVIERFKRTQFMYMPQLSEAEMERPL